jgi:hypothetical protein
MQRKIVKVGLLSLLSTSWAFSGEGGADTGTARVSMFAVPFKCEAAPQIGCGSLSKPILLELEHNAAISEAWLNRTGTILAVIGSDTSGNQAKFETVQSVLEKNGVTVNQLAGDAYAEQLKSFTARVDWYRGADVDRLSKIEAQTIAARIVHRVQATVTLTPEKVETLEAGITKAFEHRFIGSSDAAGEACNRQQLIEEITAVAQAHLNEKEIATLKAAFAKGIRPLPEDNDTTKSTVPACCRLPFQS